MPIKTACSNCNTQFKVKDEFSGKKAKCPKCGAIIRIPTTSAPPATEKQKMFARQLGISFPDDIGRHRISALIDDVLEKQNERRYQLHDSQSEAYASLRKEVLAEVVEDNPRISDASPESIVRALGDRGRGAILITFDIENLYDGDIQFSIVHDDQNMENEDVTRLLSLIGFHFAKQMG